MVDNPNACRVQRSEITNLRPNLTGPFFACWLIRLAHKYLIVNMLMGCKTGVIHRLSTLFCSLLLALVAGLPGCGPATRAEDERSIFRINLPSGLTSLDPAQASTQANLWMVSQLYETLLELDSSLHLQPALAHRYEVLEGGLRYRFYLRSGVRFVEDACFPGGRGRAVTAQDVVYSLTRLALPATASSGSWLLSGVVQGVDSLRRGQAARISGLIALNDSTVELRLVSPRSALPRLLTLPYAAIVPREAVEHYGKDFAHHPVGTGPFRLKHWQLGRSLVLLRNAGYWQAGLPRLEAIAVRFMPSRLTAFIEFKQGRLDFLEGLDPTFKDELLTPEGQLQPAWQRRARLQVSPQLATEYIGIRLDSLQTHPLLRQAWFRRVLSLGIDRPKLVRYLYNTQADASLHTFVPVGLGVGDSVLRYGYDPRLADSLLRARGYAGGRGVAPLRLLVSPGAQQLGEFLQQAWQDLGLTVELQTREGATARELIYRGQAELWRASWVADHPDAENFYLLFACDQLSPDGPNTTHHCDPAFDALLARLQSDAATSTVPLEDHLARELPVLPLFHYRTLRLLQPNIRHLPTEHLTGRLDLKRVVKE